MSVAARLIRAGAALLAPEQRSTLANPGDSVIRLLFGGEPTHAGKDVTPQIALTLVAVYSAVLVLAETMGSMPVGVFRRRPDGFTEPATDHPLWDLLHVAPNEEMTATEFQQLLQGHLATWGNAYAQIIRDGAGQAMALWPMRPDRVTVERKEDNGPLIYRQRLQSGREIVLASREVLHLRGFGGDGVKGFSPIGQARQMVGSALATEEFGARFFSNGAVSTLALRHPKVLGDTGKKNLRESFEEKHRGVANSWRPIILEEGMDVTSVGIPPKDAQFLELNGWNVEQVARLYRIPPHLLQHLREATFNNIAELGVGFLQYTMLPWIRRWDQGLAHRLMTRDERRELIVKHNVRALLRGNLKDQGDEYAKGRQWGWYSVNDIRRFEDMTPVEGGDTYHVPLNMIPLGSELDAGASDDGRSLEQRDVGRWTEKRAIRSAATRHRLAAASRSMFELAAGSIVRTETEMIQTEGLPLLGSRDAESFLSWLERFYRDEAPGLIEPRIAPALESYGQAVRSQIETELGGELEDDPRFRTQYVETFATRWTGSSRGQLRQLTQRADQEGLDAVELIEERLGEWGERRARKCARDETVRFGSALAKTLFVAAGFLRMRWVTIGKNCPTCDALDGMVVGSRETFVGAGETVKPEGAEPFTSRSSIGHPPLHGGCDCMLSPG